MIGNSRTYNATVDMGSYEWNLSTLPVELLFFQGKAKENHNHLTWITASETNNRGFHLEHSTDGRDFQEIAWIEGNGTTIEESQYDYLHKNPESYINYYRLLQEDHDGNTEYSKVIHIDNKGKKTIRIYPNPTFNILNIEVGDRNQALTVTDISGRTVLSYDNTPNQITLSDLPSGTY
ncbi:MAG: T9SS type A sorting domain-containing protein, partial [Saprospiraceae bacterium]